MEGPSTETHDSAPTEHYIPLLRQDIIEICLDDEGLKDEQKAKFRKFCDILTSYVHFEYHKKLEKVKHNYAPFDPDRSTIETEDSDTKHGDPTKAISAFREIALGAKYLELGDKEIAEAMTGEDIIELATSVDFDAYEQLVCFARGNATKEIKKKGFLGIWQKSVQTEVWERVILALRFKPADKLTGQARKEVERLPVAPGKMYVYYYRDVPKLDLELLFPNVQVGMTMRDKVTFCATAILGVVGIWFTFEFQQGDMIDIVKKVHASSAEVMGNEIHQLFEMLESLLQKLLVPLAILILGGGLVLKQWSAYRQKRVEFLKLVSETLFFRHLATNHSVFGRVLDSAEECETKEMLLVYFHLTINAHRTFTAKELDDQIELWLEPHCGRKIDFDVRNAVKKLREIRGKVASGEELPLLDVHDDGRLKILPIDDAMHVIDYIWDNAYDANQLTH